MDKSNLLFSFEYGLLVLLFLFSSVLTAGAEDQPVITVLPFQSIEVPASVSMIITTLFETNLVNTHAYSVLSQNEREQIMAAQETAVSDCTDEACAIEIGKLLAAEQIIMGTVVALGKKIIINAKIIDVLSSKALGADSTSAQSVEELDIACEKLTLALVQNAMAAAKIAETPPELKLEPEAVLEDKPADEVKPKEGVPEKLVEKKPPKKEKKKVVREPGKFNALAFATLSTGILLLEAGNLSSNLSFEFKQQSVDSWEKYLNASGNLDALYAEYDNDYSSYSIFGISSYALWGLGASVISSSLMLFPEDSFNLSIGGKITFSASLLCTLAGNYLAIIAGNQRIENRRLWDKYINASGNLDTLYDAYESGYSAYNISKILSYSLWGLGGLGMAGSFLIPGSREPAAPTLLGKILMTTGILLITGGSFTHSMALNTRQLVEEKWTNYFQAGGNLDVLYTDYDTAHKQYLLYTLLSYGLWAGGGLAVLSSLFIPLDAVFSKTVKEEQPVLLRFIPTISGIDIQLRINPKGKN